MSEKPDYVASELGQLSRDVAISVETIGPEKEKPEPSPSFSDPDEKRKPPTKSTRELLQEIILQNSLCKTAVSADATPEERVEDRRRRLNDKGTRWRVIFSQWPRDPNGKIITPENSRRGKMPPNGAEIWGATLFNFYIVRRMPDVSQLATLSSGSKLAAWMKANRENYAKEALDFAKEESDPYQIFPYNITGLIQDGDRSVWDRSWVGNQDQGNKKGKGKKREDWQVPQPWPPASPFDPRAYPQPWPIEPFTRHYPKLQKYLIHSHLPTILKVHDPWNLLRASRDYEQEDWDEDKKKKWSEKTDVVHTYRLKTSTKHKARKIKDDKIAKKEEKKRKAIYDTFIADPHSKNEFPDGIVYLEDAHTEPGPARPPIFIVHPYQPRIPPAREAHLYLSPSDSIGQGSHSSVYSAEFELPRSTIMDDEICNQCIMEDMLRTLKKEDGPNGERRDPKWDQKVGRNIVKSVGHPPLTLSLHPEGNNDGYDGEQDYLLREDTQHSTLEYEGPFRLIHSKIGYQCLERGPYCKHIATSHKGIHPLTAKVKVVAKLSIDDDLRLAREADQYQAFPRHFFEHWSGYNLIKPLRYPTPVGPLVPQFYGYYVPDIDADQLDAESRPGTPRPELRRHLSPILLLEDCGRQINPDELTLDDQSEAAALVFRFHDAGWLHGSIAKRNILRQPGPLSDFPLRRYANIASRGGHGVDWSFRLINFGRTREVNELPDHEASNLIMVEEIPIRNWVHMDGGLQ